MVGFNTIPSNIVAPIFTFEVNSAGNFENQSRMLLIGHKTSAGEATLDEPVICTSLLEAARLAGPGSMLYEMVRAVRLNAPAQELWILPVTEVGTAAEGEIVVDDVPAAGGVGYIDIAGQRIAVTIPAGTTVGGTATLLGVAIADYFNEFDGAYVPISGDDMAISVGEASVTLPIRHKGAYGNAIDVHVPAVAGNAFTGNLTITAPASGAGVPDLSDGLAALGDDAFDWIVTPFNDATSLAAYKALLSDVSGRWAWNRQVYGHVFMHKQDSISNLTTFGLTQDDRHITTIPMPASGVPQPAYFWVAAMVARVAPWLADGVLGNVSRNQTGLVVQGLQPPRSRLDYYDYATRGSLLVSGISTWSVDGAGRVSVDKLITMQRTTNNVPDSTFRDIQMIGQIMYSLRYLRERLTIEHGQKALGQDNPRGLTAITTVREIKATLVLAYRELERRGVTVNAKKAAELIDVVQNSANANRVDVLMPIDMADPLDIIAVNAKIHKQFATAA